MYTVLHLQDGKLTRNYYTTRKEILELIYDNRH